MNREPINARRNQLEDLRHQLLERCKTPSGAWSHSVAAIKRQARAEEIAGQIKKLTIRDDVLGADCAYDVPLAALAGKTWRSKTFPEIPPLGTAVFCTLNTIGPGVVVGYFFEHGYAGVIIQLSDAPAWHRKQNEDTWHSGHALVLGSEIRAV